MTTTTTTPQLPAVDAATVARVTQNHGTYIDLRHTTEPVNYASWAGIFEVNIEELLEIIDRLTGNAPAPEPLPRIAPTGTGWPV